MHTRVHRMEQVDEDEVKLFETRKHPLGIIILYVQATLGMMLAIGLSYFLIPLVVTNTSTAFNIANIFTAIAILLSFVILTIATIIYRENRIIVTDRNITQVLQYGLFSRKVSQLNLENIEDVTAVQQGILATMFNFGILKIETAGEQVNFHFTYCPRADYYAKIILDAREKMLGQAETSDDSPSKASKSFANESTTDTTREASVTEIKGIGAETIKQASSNNEY